MTEQSCPGLRAGTERFRAGEATGWADPSRGKARPGAVPCRCWRAGPIRAGLGQGNGPVGPGSVLGVKRGLPGIKTLRGDYQCVRAHG